MNLRLHIYNILLGYLGTDEAGELSNLLCHEIEHWGGKELLNADAPEVIK